MRELLRLACCVMALTMTSGCAVGMAMSGATNQDASILFPGAPRDVVIAKVGAPETSEVDEQGNRADSFLITKGNESSPGRAGMHAVLDLLTFFLWEFIGTAMEMGASREKTSRYFVVYDKDDKIKDVKAVESSSKTEH